MVCLQLMLVGWVEALAVVAVGRAFASCDEAARMASESAKLGSKGFQL